MILRVTGFFEVNMGTEANIAFAPDDMSEMLTSELVSILIRISLQANTKHLVVSTPIARRADEPTLARGCLEVLLQYSTNLRKTGGCVFLIAHALLLENHSFEGVVIITITFPNIAV